MSLSTPRARLVNSTTLGMLALVLSKVISRRSISTCDHSSDNYSSSRTPVSMANTIIGLMCEATLSIYRDKLSSKRE